MEQQLFQDIFDRLAPVIPSNWARLLFRCQYSAGSYSMIYYADEGTGTYVSCFEQPGANRADLIKTFMELDRLIAPARGKLSKKERWTALTMSVSKNGSFHSEFCYEDLSESGVSFVEEWEKKYLTR